MSSRVTSRQESGARGVPEGDESGLVLVWFGLLLLVLMGMAGMAVDLGTWYGRGHQLQRAADAAALAGVVWMPDDFAEAEASALAALRRNGIDPDTDPDLDVTVAPDPTSPFRLQVQVTDNRIATYFSKPFLDNVVESRRSTGEYVLPVPLGSPTNFIGTGTMLSGLLRENLNLAVNGFCTAKEDGDLVLSRYDGTKTGSPANRCPNAGSAPTGPGPAGYSEDNTQYSSAGYTYYVELPPSRTQSVTLAIYDAPYYTASSSSPDLPLASPSAVTTTFRLRQADNTPLDDTDNPLYTCTGSGETNPRSFTTDQGSVFNMTITGSTRWTRMCTIPTSAPAGRWLLETWTTASQASSVGVNAYGLFLQRGVLATTCDARTDSTCPRVYGKDRLSVFARQAASTGQFYLAEIDSVHAGKQMVVSLWDPGEGGSTIQILDPNGNPTQFDYWTSEGDYTGSNVTQLDVSGSGSQPGPNRGSTSKMNDRFVTLAVNLPINYTALYGTNEWWRIRYTFSSGTVSDRTTWSVQIRGDPVHLVTEN